MAYAIIKRQVREYGCTTIEELSIKKAYEIKNLCDKYKEMK